MPRNFVSGVQLRRLRRLHLGNIEIGPAGKAAHVRVPEQTGIQIEGALYAPFPQKRGETAVLHHAVIIAEGTGLALSAGEYEGIKSFSHDYLLSCW